VRNLILIVLILWSFVFGAVPTTNHHWVTGEVVYGVTMNANMDRMLDSINSPNYADIVCKTITLEEATIGHLGTKNMDIIVPRSLFRIICGGTIYGSAIGNYNNVGLEATQNMMMSLARGVYDLPLNSVPVTFNAIGIAIESSPVNTALRVRIYDYTKSEIYYNSGTITYIAGQTYKLLGSPIYLAATPNQDIVVSIDGPGIPAYPQILQVSTNITTSDRYRYSIFE
jgi:hypothetical protein